MRHFFGLWIIGCGLWWPTMAQAQWRDIAITHPHYHALIFVKQQGVFGSNSIAFINSEKFVSRYELAIWLEKIFKTSSKATRTLSRREETVNFIEASKMILSALSFKVSSPQGAQWYEPYVAEMAKRKAIPASIDRFDQNITRGEAAEMIYRIKKHRRDKPTRQSHLRLSQWEKVPFIDSPKPYYAPFTENAYQQGLGNHTVGLYFTDPRCKLCQSIEASIVKNLGQLPADSLLLKVDHATNFYPKARLGVKSPNTLVILDKKGRLQHKIQPRNFKALQAAFQ